MLERCKVFNGNRLKLLAVILMTIDHIGMLLFPTVGVLRIIGRAAFPIFAYMIAEGCRYTRSLPRYLLTLITAAVPCQVAYAVAERSAYQCVLVTFACSVLLILFLKRAQSSRKPLDFVWFAIVLALMTALYILARIYGKAVEFDVDYGMVGILLPLLIYLGRTPRERWLLAALGFTALAMSYGGTQWWCLMALAPLALYNGERGRARLKYGFYIYYPLHLAILYLIALWA